MGSWTNVSSTAVTYHAAGLLTATQYYYTFKVVNANESLWAGPSWTMMTPLLDYAAPNMTLTVVSEHGDASQGTIRTNSGVELGCFVVDSPVINGTTQYVADGAAVDGNAFTQVSPTNITLVLTNNATVTWRWTTNYWLAVNTSGQGSLDADSTWVAAGSSLAVTATPSNHWNFEGWSGDTDGCVIAGAVITPVMSQARNMTASFSAALAANNTPIWWLAQHGWTNGFDEAASADTDGDGLPNWAEYIAGTDPTNRGSSLAITSMPQPGGTNVVFAWPSVDGKVYDVMRTANLMDSWSVITSNIPATPPDNVYTDSVPAATQGMYYKIRVLGN